MEIDKRDWNEIVADLCYDNPDILLKTVLTFSKYSIYGLLSEKEEHQKMNNNE